MFGWSVENIVDIVYMAELEPFRNVTNKNLYVNKTN